MYQISSVEISGFRGVAHPIKMNFHSTVNFIIGRNGTGKTSFINLINYALQVEVAMLANSEFESIIFRFSRAGDRLRPFVKITKTTMAPSETKIDYQISHSAKSKGIVYSITTSDFIAPWRRKDAAWIISRRLIRDDHQEAPDAIRLEMSKLTTVSWISVHRGLMNAPEDGERKFMSPVDRKLNQVARDFGSYFSTLDKMAATETDKFQQFYLLSLISPPGFQSISTISNINVEDEKAAIGGMFTEFNIKSNVYSGKLESFSKRMTKALSKYNPTQSMDADDFLVLTDTVRIHNATEEWRRLLSKRSKIYEPKNDFIKIVNELFYKKTIEINSGNQPVFRDPKGKEIDLDHLSSGEKQMFILLGETLLQRRQNCVFMADEPELSLHIDWQERLVPSLLRINPNAQIVFATHSPDIVGAYGQNTIDLENIL